MNEFLQTLYGYITGFTAHKHFLVIGSLTMARMLALVVGTPFLGGKNIPSMVKLGVAFSVTLLVWPLVIQQVPNEWDYSALLFISLLLKEVFIGFAMGLLISEVFYLIETSGALMDFMRYSSMSQGFVPETGERSTSLGAMGFQFMIALFLALGYHAFFFQGVVESFEAIPVNQFPEFSAGYWGIAETFINLISHMFNTAFMLAFPIAILSLIIDSGFGMLNRVAPQVNAFFLSLPAKTLGGLVIFFFAFPMAVEQYNIHAAEIIRVFYDFIGLLR